MRTQLLLLLGMVPLSQIVAEGDKAGRNVGAPGGSIEIQVVAPLAHNGGEADGGQLQQLQPRGVFGSDAGRRGLQIVSWFVPGIERLS